ncbi:uncharacterized protein IUM83_06925 [Phytophthora cinnamomi]|uniref:uncharacterized protein n=1 Tax=Phytophthora cinnamomi TaxID=4785 RepID=UPI003559B881|nr:hypothetical protein IUM83_06925 [Phytophthora cinnamomi]
MHGFTNLMNHLRRFRPTYEIEAEEELRSSNVLLLHVVNPRTTEMDPWLEWKVEERLPFTFTERRCSGAAVALRQRKTG